MNIKLANVLLFGNVNTQMNVKLADQGAFTFMDFPGADLLTKPVECLGGDAYTAKGDVW